MTQVLQSCAAQLSHALRAVSFLTMMTSTARLWPELPAPAKIKLTGCSAWVTHL